MLRLVRACWKSILQHWKNTLQILWCYRSKMGKNRNWTDQKKSRKSDHFFLILKQFKNHEISSFFLRFVLDESDRDLHIAHAHTDRMCFTLFSSQYEEWQRMSWLWLCVSMPHMVLLLFVKLQKQKWNFTVSNVNQTFNLSLKIRLEPSVWNHRYCF